jgi:hypothetical protein
MSGKETSKDGEVGRIQAVDDRHPPGILLQDRGSARPVIFAVSAWRCRRPRWRAAAP